MPVYPAGHFPSLSGLGIGGSFLDPSGLRPSSSSFSPGSVRSGSPSFFKALDLFTPTGGVTPGLAALNLKL